MSTFVLKESERASTDVRFSRVVPAGDFLLERIEAGETVRLTDLEGNQAADTLFFNASDKAERYSAVDTIQQQRALYLTTGSVLMSNRGNPLLEIVADTCGRHDTLGGACATESNTVRYAHNKKHMHACRDSYLLAAGTRPDVGLTKRDIANNINFFMNVPVTPEGGLTFEDGVSAPGRYVELRAIMPVHILLSNCPQLNNPCNGYNPTPVEVSIWSSDGNGSTS